MVGDLFDIKCYLEISERIFLAMVVPFEGPLWGRVSWNLMSVACVKIDSSPMTSHRAPVRIKGHQLCMSSAL